MNYASNKFEASTYPMGNPWIRSNFSPRGQNCVSILYPSAVLDGQFFWKGKMSDPDILYIAKPYKLDLVDLFSGAIRTQKWTLYLKTPPHYKLKHLYSTLPVQIPTPTRRGSHSLTLGTNDRSPTGEC